MSNLKLTTHGGLVESTIIAKQETYYLVTSDNLNSIKSKSLLSDLFVFLASLSWGAFFSVITTISSIPKAANENDPINKILLPLKTLKDVFMCAGILFSILTIIMIIYSFHSLSELKKSGKLEIKQASDNN
jgi:hypothetical protein